MEETALYKEKIKLEMKNITNILKEILHPWYKTKVLYEKEYFESSKKLKTYQKWKIEHLKNSFEELFQKIVQKYRSKIGKIGQRNQDS